MHEGRQVKLKDIIEAVNKRWKDIFVATLVVLIVAGIVNYYVMVPQYEVSVKIFIGKKSYDDGTDKDMFSNSDVDMYKKLLSTYTQFFVAEDGIQDAITNGGLDISADTVRQNLKVEQIEDTQVIKATYKDTDRYRAKEVLDLVTNQFISKSQSLITNGTVNIIESAKVPEFPVSPNKKKNIAFAGIIALMMSAFICIVIEVNDTTIIDGEDLEGIFSESLIGLIPDQNKRA